MSAMRNSLIAAFLFALGLGTGIGWAHRSSEGPATRRLLDNKRIEVTEVTLAPSARREAYTRPTDQLIVFLDEARYQAIDASGKIEDRKRAVGDIVWHDKGDAAPVLVNTGAKPYRNLVIAFK